MIIDAHVHVHPDRDGMGAAHDARVDRLLREMDAGPVDRVVLLAEAFDVPYVKAVSNAFVGRCCLEHPDRFIGFASVHPGDPGAADALREALDQYPLHGLKLHPRFQGVAIDDPRVEPLAALAVERGLPIAVDALLWKPTPLALQMPLRIDGLCKRFPEARVIVSHAGGFRFLDALALVVANEHVYLEISTVLRYFLGTPFEDQFMFVLKKAGARRVIYGSDHPQHPLNACYAEAREALERHGFDEEELTWIFGRTLLSVLPETAR